MRLKRYDEALADFSQAIALDQFGTAKFYEQRGIAYFEKGQTAEARDDWEYAASIDSGATVALIRLGSMSLEEERDPRAIDYFSRAIAAEPTLAVAFVNRSRAYLAMGQTVEAFDDLRRADELVQSGRDTSNAEQEL
jgi:tetratricopeptide (TPR) repeat protein